MNYIYIISYVYAVTTYRSVSYKHLHRHTPFFLNFNIEYSGFYSSFYSGKCYFLQNNVLTPFYLCICAFTYNIL